MAFTYKTPVESLLSKFTSDEQSKICSVAAERIASLEKAEHNFFSYYMSDEAKKILTDRGVRLSVIAHQVHSHPVCKTVENHILYNVMKSYIDNSFYVVSIKNNKLEYLRARNKMPTLSYINRYVSAKDISRYGLDRYFDRIKEGEVTGYPERNGKGKRGGWFPLFEKAKKEFTYLNYEACNSETLKDLVPQALTKKAKRFFLHDELHYWSLDDLNLFLCAVKPEILVATHVFPKEILKGVHESYNKWMYDFKVEGDKLFYYPDCCLEEGYEQPMHGGQIYHLNSFTTTEGDIYTISMVYNLFSHSVFQISKGRLKSETQRGFSGFQASPTNELSIFGGTILNTFGVKCSLIKKMYLYLRTLKKPDIESAMAKLRQLEPDPSGKSIIFIENFAEFLLKHKTGHNLIENGLVQRFESFMISLLPDLVKKNFESHYKSNLCEFISNLEDEKVIINCIDGDVNTSEWSFLYPKIDLMRRKLTEAIPNVGSEIVIFFKKHLRNPEFRRKPRLYSKSNVCVEFLENAELGEIKRSLQFFLYRMSDYILRRDKRKIKCMVMKGDFSYFTISTRFNRFSDLFKLYQVELCNFINDYLSFRLSCFPEQKFLMNVSYEQLLRQKERELQQRAKNQRNFDWVLFELKKNARFKIKKILADSSTDPSGIPAGSSACKDTDLPDEVQDCNCGFEGQFEDFFNDSNFLVDPSEVTANKDIPVEVQAADVAVVDELDTCPFSSFFDKETKTANKECKEAEDPCAVKSSRYIYCKCGVNIILHSIERSIEVDGVVFTDSLKGRVASLYSRNGMGYSYSGFSHNPKEWLPSLDLLIDLCGEAREDYNQCLVQRYEEGSTINYHSDNEELYPKGNKILTVNASGSGLFGIKCKDGEVNFSLSDGDFFVMPGGFQETHKHRILAKTERISYTFRSTEVNNPPNLTTEICVPNPEEFELINRKALSSDFYRIKLNSMHVLSKKYKFDDLINFNEFKVRGDGNCFWHCITSFLGGTCEGNKELCASFCDASDLAPSAMLQFEGNNWAEDESIFLACSTFSIEISLFDTISKVVHEFKPVNAKTQMQLNLIYNGSHFNLLVPKEGCVIRAIAESLSRSHLEILNCLSKPENLEILNELNSGSGLPLSLLERCFKIFGIHAFVSFENIDLEFNQKGTLHRMFILSDGHLEYTGRTVNHHELGRKKISHERNLSSIFAGMSGGNFLDFTSSLDKFKRLEKSFLEGFTGKILSSKFGGPEHLIKNSDLKVHQTRVWYVVGTFGSGKSFGVKKEIKSRLDVNFLVISPRRKLAEVFKEDLGLKKFWKKGQKTNFDVVTFETAIKYKSYKRADVVILDELQLFPPGYLDLIVTMSNAKDILVLGDPAQSSYDNEEDREIFEGSDNDLVEILRNKSYKYLIRSRRFKNSFVLNRLPCSFDDLSIYPNETYYIYEDIRKEIQSILENDVILCSSFDEKKSISYIIGGRKEVLTFGESTGLTFRNVCVVITQNVKLTDEKRILVALSRASFQTNFLNHTSEKFEIFVASMPNSVLFRYCAAKSSVTDLLSLLPGKPNFIDNFDRIGKDEVDREARMIGDPWLKTMIFLGQREQMEQEESVESTVIEPRTMTHHPVAGINSVRALNNELFRAKENREFRIDDAVTEQFRDSYNVKDFYKTSNQCELFEAIYPRHKGTDSVTFLMAVRKRLSFSDPMINESKFNAAKTYGLLMFNHFIKYIPLRDNRDEEMFAEARADFERKKLEKNIATLENHSGRSSADWDIREAFIFMKSQLCTKFEKRFCDAKAGQTLACFSHIVLCRFAPWIRYIEKKVFEVLPPNFYIHSGKNFDQLKKWVIDSNFSGECTESDYEAFDSSQDATILSFEVELMKFLHVPHDVIEDYKFIKFNLYSRLGIFEIMRFTGEAGTFLFNTLANICFTLMRYDIRGDECIAFAGDDMCANSHLRVTTTFEHILDRMKLKAKVEHKVQASFCGWVLGPYGIFKKPQLVLERFMVSKERGTLHECIDNYAIEVSYGYRMGDRVFEFMTEEEIECQNLCIRTIVLNKNIMKETALSYFNGDLSKLE